MFGLGKRKKLEDWKTKTKTKTTFSNRLSLFSHVSSPVVIKMLSWLTQLNITFHLLIKSKMLKVLNVIMLINVKMSFEL